MKNMTKNKNMKLIFFIILIAIAFLIISSQDTFAIDNNSSNTSSTQLFLNVTLPEIVKDNQITIQGKTLPGTALKLFVNGKEKKRLNINNENFLMYNVYLDKTKNNIVLQAEKDGQIVKKEFNVEVDSKPASITAEVPVITTTSTMQIKGTTDEPVTLTIKITDKSGNNTKIINEFANGSFTINAELFEGENKIVIIGEDKAGHKTSLKRETILDIGPPQFLSTNLENLNPTYRRDVRVRGQLSEKASVTVFVNGKPQETILSDEDGTFSVDIELTTTSGSLTIEEQRLQLQAGGGYKNKVYIQATDIAGQTSTTNEYEIEYTICGYGSWFKTTFSEPIPEILTPRLLLEGLQQSGLAFELEYTGDRDIRIRTNAIRAKTLALSPSTEKSYDNKWVTINTVTAPVRGYENKKVKGYVQLLFNPMDLSPDDNAATTNDKLLELSDYRKGECLLPGLGCAKLMMELEVPFQEIKKKWVTNPYTNQPIEEEILEDKTQKICIQQEIAIDQLIPPKLMPKGLLKFFSSAILQPAMDGIDFVLKPLDFIGKVTTVSCLIGGIAMYALKVNENYNCYVSSAAGVLTGDTFDVSVAKAGLCEEIYASSSQKKENCLSCTDAAKTYQEAKNVHQQVCDRVACPDAPTLQTFIKRQTGKLNKIAGGEAIKGLDSKYLVNGDLYEGSDCAAWLKVNNKEGKLINYEDVKNIYSEYLSGKTTAEECNGLHPATPSCCGQEYMKTWGSSCGISGIEELDTFDEIKESACIAAEKVGQNEVEGQQCNKLWNSIAGFCEPDGGATTETIKVTKFSDKQIKDLGLSEFSPEQMLYIFMVPMDEENKRTLGLTNTKNNYLIQLGYVVETLDFEKSDKSGIIASTNRHYLTAKLEAVALSNTDLMNIFTTQVIDQYYEKGTISDVDISKFKTAVCNAAGMSGCITDLKAEELFKRIIEKIGTVDKEYVVRPSSNILRSGQCVCLPGIVGNLKLWKGIMNAVKNCIDTVRLTGEGSEGVCQAVFENYLCDAIYDGLSCFSESYSGTNTNSRVDVDGINGIMTALSTSASDISNDIEGRYGETALFKAMFVDRKLVHSICAFAFTGTWSLDIDTLFDMAVNEVPIDSTVLLYPCSRRFVGYDPGSYPTTGLTRWMYHFGVGVAAGSNLDLRLKLKCSEDYTCSESDGYANGQCDCKNGARELEITPAEISTTIPKNEVFNREIYATLQGDQSLVRYDKAELSWSWTDLSGKIRQENVQCKISQSGTPPPIFCAFDVFTLSFRCIFGEQEGSIRFRDLNINAKHNLTTESKENLNVFLIDEELNATLGVSQKYPTPPKDIYKKFLTWYLKDSSGRIIIPPKDLEKDEFLGKSILSTNGDYNIKMSDNGIRGAESLVINESWLKDSSQTITIYEWNYGDTSLHSTQALTNYNVEITTENGKRLEEDIAFVVVIQLVPSTDKYEYTLYKTDQSTTVTKEGGFGFEKILKTETRDDIEEVVLEYTSIADHYRVKITVPKKINKIEGKRKEFKIIYTKGRPICKENPTTPQKFTLVFEAFDSDQYGNPTKLQSIDPSTGSLVEIKQDFYVVCEMLKEKVVEKVTLKQIKDLLTELIKDEELIKEKIKEYVDKGITFFGSDINSDDVIKNIKEEYLPDEELSMSSLNTIIELYNEHETDSDKKLNTKNVETVLSLMKETIDAMKNIEQIKTINPTQSLDYVNKIFELFEKTLEYKQKLLADVEKLQYEGRTLCPESDSDFACKTICGNDEQSRTEDYICQKQGYVCCEKKPAELDESIFNILGYIDTLIKESESAEQLMNNFKTKIETEDDYNNIKNDATSAGINLKNFIQILNTNKNDIEEQKKDIENVKTESQKDNLRKEYYLEKINNLLEYLNTKKEQLSELENKISKYEDRKEGIVNNLRLTEENIGGLRISLEDVYKWQLSSNSEIFSESKIFKKMINMVHNFLFDLSDELDSITDSNFEQKYDELKIKIDSFEEIIPTWINVAKLEVLDKTNGLNELINLENDFNDNSIDIAYFDIDDIDSKNFIMATVASIETLDNFNTRLLNDYAKIKGKNYLKDLIFGQRAVIQLVQDYTKLFEIKLDDADIKEMLYDDGNFISGFLLSSVTGTKTEADEKVIEELENYSVPLDQCRNEKDFGKQKECATDILKGIITVLNNYIVGEEST